MYIPPHFAETQPDELHRILREHPFASLVTQGADGPDANHLPFEFDADSGPHGRLIGHVARANPILQEVADGSPVLVIFRAGDAYISPNWYPSKHEAHRQVPTWNYQVVHVHGVLRFQDDEKFLRGVLARLTRTHEADQPRPWRMGDSAPEFIDGMLKAIVGVEIEIGRIVGKSKLSQNKEARDRLGAADGLQQRGETTVSAAMRAAGGS
ncbi:FMN-binding negative transcriptional regulator [Xylophilus rhododendri]|uniref:FMN-binding negative transcriptional regulator n=1 Tax=Xylophilus rhododendri TaxID=2697032 RepID=A0A857JAL4_9BURK|nr:FMN-binding negative transcriptional regulator [Xylophilus rhododendri]QHJ00023.1 FMN-binding negative transcriptional regulator [Xylophilus rhododendri]